MQSQHYEPLEPTVVRFPPPIYPSSPVEDAREAAVQDYLDQVCAPLIGAMPYAARVELRAEIEQHFRALVEAHLELGAPHEAAFAQAVEQFGRPEQVARQWHPQAFSGRSLSRPRRWLSSQWQGFCVALFLAGVMGLSALSALQGTRTAVAIGTNLQSQVAQTNPGEPVQRNIHAGTGFQHTDFANAECSQCHRDGASSLSTRFDFYVMKLLRQEGQGARTPGR